MTLSLTPPYAFLRPMLFQLSPETAHRMSVHGLEQAGMCALTRSFLEKQYGFTDLALSQTLWGLAFPNPIGIAAGFDKDGRAIPGLEALGFGHVEIGTITPKPQEGNKKPRIHRLVEEEAVINRMGFPSEGAETVERRLARRKKNAIPIGINIGKNKDTPLDHAVDDYLAALRLLAPHGDYITVNVSSPNTPGLRALQSRTTLEPLLATLRKHLQTMANDTGQAPLPLLVKIAPDLAPEEIDDVAQLALEGAMDGIIAANTSIGREGLKQQYSYEGGLSGRPILNKNLAVVRRVRQTVQNKIPIIGVGGISSGADAYTYLKAGASLVQIYTSLIYQGPEVVAEMKKELLALLKQDGFQRVGDCVGVEAQVQ